MEVVIRSSKNGQWAFVEGYSIYRYGSTGSITVTLGISYDGKMVKPYVYRGEEFVPLSQIEKEMGIEKYIKAKKPFYSKLADGVIATLRVGVNFATGEYLPDKSYYKVYDIRSWNAADYRGTLQLSRIVDVPEPVDKLLKRISESIATCKDSRLEFLKMRIKEHENEE